MKQRTLSTLETAIVSAAGATAVGLVAAFGEATGQLLWLAFAGVAALAVFLGFRYLITGKRAQLELAGSERYRDLADEYRRLTDLAIATQEHTDMKLGEVTVQLDYLREQNESLQKILREVE